MLELISALFEWLRSLIRLPKVFSLCLQAGARSTGRGSRAGVVVSFGGSFVDGVLRLRKTGPVVGRLNASHTTVWMVGFIGHF